VNAPDAVYTAALGISNGFDVTLYALDSTFKGHASLNKGSSYQLIDVRGALASEPRGVANNGDVVYTWADSSGHEHGALRHARKYYKFRISGTIGTWGVGINDNNQIVGFSQRTLKSYYRGVVGSYSAH
jgi:hypothetical protein